MGVVNAINLDGGGSSTIVYYLNTLVVCNKSTISCLFGLRRSLTTQWSTSLPINMNAMVSFTIVSAMSVLSCVFTTPKHLRKIFPCRLKQIFGKYLNFRMYVSYFLTLSNIFVFTFTLQDPVLVCMPGSIGSSGIACHQHLAAAILSTTLVFNLPYVMFRLE